MHYGRPDTIPHHPLRSPADKCSSRGAGVRGLLFRAPAGSALNVPSVLLLYKKHNFPVPAYDPLPPKRALGRGGQVEQGPVARHRRGHTQREGSPPPLYWGIRSLRGWRGARRRQECCTLEGGWGGSRGPARSGPARVRTPPRRHRRAATSLSLGIHAHVPPANGPAPKGHVRRSPHTGTGSGRLIWGTASARPCPRSSWAPKSCASLRALCWARRIASGSARSLRM